MPELTEDNPGAEKRLTGRAVSPGLGMGRAWVVGDVLAMRGPPSAIHPSEVEKELLRLTHSFEDALTEVDRHAKRIEEEFDSTLAGVFRAHAAMLRELLASGEFERELRGSLVDAEAVVRRVLRKWYHRFKAIENQIFRQRADDVLDLGRNIIRRLRGEEQAGFKAMPPDSILVVERLLPSDVVLLPKAHVAAVLVETLGQGSHAALLAREKGIPTVTDLQDLLEHVDSGAELLVDGFRGTVIINPPPTVQAEFRERLERWQATLVRCKSACREPATSRDGVLVRVEANIGVEDDVELALDNGADGVGLLRVEQIYFSRQAPPTEDELYQELQTLLQPLGDRPATIRLLDIGADKPLPYLGLPITSNPTLGRRGVRLLLQYPHLVRTQFAAILRLAQDRPLRVLIPMVTLEEDIVRMREDFEETVRERKIAEVPAFGAMVETPAAALAVPHLGRHVDFFCVGTNDLAQYTLAAGRDDPTVNDYYVDSHESVMRLLGIIVQDAKDRPVTLCGELAGREAIVPQLLKIGFRHLSVAPTVIPTTKALIRNLRLNGEPGNGQSGQR